VGGNPQLNAFVLFYFVGGLSKNEEKIIKSGGVSRFCRRIWKDSKFKGNRDAIGNRCGAILHLENISYLS
jgi:hypothetical protein